MVNTPWFRLYTNKNFTGYVSSIQNNVTNFVSASAETSYSASHPPINAFAYSSYFPYASSSVAYCWFAFDFKKKPFFITHYELL